MIPGTVESFDKETGAHEITYDDDMEEELDLLALDKQRQLGSSSHLPRNISIFKCDEPVLRLDAQDDRTKDTRST